MSEHTGYPGAPPGWYPDPAGGPGQRWWDGYAWTAATVIPGAGAPAPHRSSGEGAWTAASIRLDAFNATALVDREMRMVSVGRVAVALPAAASIVNLVVARVNSDRWLAFGRHLRIVWDDAQHHVTPPPYTGPSVSTPVDVLVSLISIAAVVVALIWQHRAASAGRALGIPARQSPAWGVGAWFVPIVNLWIPYFAVRDCLPLDDPHRRRVLHWWLAWLLTVGAGLAANVAGMFSSGVALALSIPAAVGGLAVIAWAPGIVTAVATAHRVAMDVRARETGALAPDP